LSSQKKIFSTPRATWFDRRRIWIITRLASGSYGKYAAIKLRKASDPRKTKPESASPQKVGGYRTNRGGRAKRSNPPTPPAHTPKHANKEKAIKAESRRTIGNLPDLRKGGVQKEGLITLYSRDLIGRTGPKGGGVDSELTWWGDKRRLGRHKEGTADRS